MNGQSASKFNSNHDRPYQSPTDSSVFSKPVVATDSRNAVTEQSSGYYSIPAFEEVSLLSSL